MWSALDWTGMLTTSEKDNLDNELSSKGSKEDTESDTGGETGDEEGMRDSDSNTSYNYGGIRPNKFRDNKAFEKADKIRNGFFCVLLLLGIVMIGAALLKEKEDNKIAIYDMENVYNLTCSGNESKDYETAFVTVSLDGMYRKATEEEKRVVEEVVYAVYNNVTDGCDDLYERFMDGASVVNQTLLEGPKGNKTLTMDLTTYLSCTGCGIESEILFGKGQPKDIGGAEETFGEVLPGDRNLVVQEEVSSKHRQYRTRGAKGSRRIKGDKSPNPQEFIDELDRNLQSLSLPLKKVKEGFIYKQDKSKDSKKGDSKVKLIPKAVEYKKDKDDGKKDPKGDPKESPNRRFRNRRRGQ